VSMERLEALLAEWRATPPLQVSLGSIRQADAYQPRNLRLAPYKHRGRLEEASAEHVADLAAKLGDGRDLDPLLVARIDGALYLIDGHHRTKAYRRVSRSSAPARIRDCTESEALMASKAVNCDGVKLPMHVEQRREAAWQYLAMLTAKGCRTVPEGASLRAVARIFGTSKDTVARMVKKLAQVNPRDYSPEACDPGTGWPQWKHVKGNTFRDAFLDQPADARLAHRAEKLATKLGREIERYGLDAFLLSLRLIGDEAVAAEAERLGQVMAAEGADY